MIASARGNTAIYRVETTAIVETTMNNGFTYVPILGASTGADVNSAKPRYTKMKFSESCARVWKMDLVARWVLRDIVW